MNGQKFSLNLSLPQKIGRLIHENQVIKMMAFFAYLIAILAVFVTLMLSSKPPVVVPLDNEAKRVELYKKPDLSTKEISEAIRQYVGFRYTWDTHNGRDQLKSAEGFVAPGALKSFAKVSEALLKFGQEKQVSQRVYITNLAVQEKENIVTVTADRFDEIQGLRAASLLTLKLSYELGEPTLENPWGVYINKEEEVVRK